MSERAFQEEEKEGERRKVKMYEAPRVLASYSKEEMEAVMQPGGGGGCGCGSSCGGGS